MPHKRLLPVLLLSSLILPSGRVCAGPADASVRFASLHPDDVRAEALRDAVHSGLSLRRSAGTQARDSALRGVFDGGRGGSAAESVRDSGRRHARRLAAWHIEPEFERFAGLSRLWTGVQSPSAAQRLRSAATAALEPFRAALEYAWGGAWTGAAALRSFDIIR